MAKTILDKVSLDLSYKLQDPVSTGTANGARLTAAERLSYIVRGYKRLLRLVTLLHPTLVNLLFKSYFTITTKTTTVGGIIANTDFPRAEIFSIYAKQPGDEEYVKTRMVPIGYGLDVEYGENTFYTADLNTNQIYWYEENDNVKLLPPVRYETQILYRPDIMSIVESEGYDGTTDLDIPSDFTDILLSSAAAEAYMDLGEMNLVTGYKNDLAEQLAVLANTQKKKEKKDEI